MKLIFSVITILFLISCSVSPEKKAQKAIVEKLKLTLNDFKSYDPVEFGTITIKLSELESQNGYESNLENGFMFLKKYEKLKKLMYNKDLIKLFQKEALADLDSAKFYKNRNIEIKNNFKQDTIGWQMKHSFRSKNMVGAYILTTLNFVLDKNISKVVNIDKLQTE